MRTGSFAPAMAVFSSTPSTPSSMAMAASEAVPTPASTMTGTLALSRMRRMLCGLRMPRPEPMGARAASPPRARVLQLARRDGIVGGVGQHHEALLHQDAAS